MADWFTSVRTHGSSLDPRELLYGDVPLATFARLAAGAGGGAAGGAAAEFADAAARLERDDQAGARAVLAAVAARPGLEPRFYLQAWDALRRLGAAPPAAEAKHLYGVVVDVPAQSGLPIGAQSGVDTLAAYEDHTARYFNFGGGSVVWEHPDDSLDPAIDALLDAGRTIVARIGPWTGARPPLPPRLTRLSFLTPSGLHFGQAPFDTLARDAMAAPAMAAATALVKALVAKTG